jgi:hypothetical protein
MLRVSTAGKLDCNNVTWIDKQNTFPMIENLKMAFVNRKKALFQLQNIHMKNLHRALYQSGDDWIVPICDNIFGLGKSEFADQYVRKVNEGMAQEPISSDLQRTFQRSMMKAHTVKVTFHAGEMQNENTFEEVLVRKLQEALIPLFKVAPICLFMTYTRSDQFLSELISDSGPIFVALDEIGSAFSVLGMNDLQRRDLFMKFCSAVLSSWLLIPNLHFLLLGRGSFLNYVGCRPGVVEELTASPFKFERLSLQFLRPQAIIEILRGTHFGGKTLFSHYELDDEKAAKVASYLYAQTTGHPRSLLHAFMNCLTCPQLLSYTRHYAVDNYKDFYNYISIYKDEINFMLGRYALNDTVDLSEGVLSRGKFTPRELIVTNAFMAWEGTLDAARLEVSPETIDLIATYFSSFKEYLCLIMRSLTLSLDFADIFEVMLMKRFQQLFQEAKSPSEVLGDFFNTPLFGSCQDLRISDIARPMPQIRTRGAGRGLEDAHVNQKLWPFLLEEMDRYDSLCLKPPLHSASSDVLFVGNVNRFQFFCRYAVGLAAKKFAKTSCANLNDIHNECAKFNAMFNDSDKKVCRLNILIICATQYGAGLQAKFGERKFFILEDISCWKNIDEVIVLDLTSWENRAQFFGLSLDDPLKSAVEGVISKYVTL